MFLPVAYIAHIFLILPMSLSADGCFMKAFFIVLK